MSFSTLASILRSSWRRPKLPLVKLPRNAVKIYERTPPPWARWALVLVSVDIMVSASAVDVLWNAWTMPDPTLHDSKVAEGNDSKPAVGKTTPTEEKPSMIKFQIIPPGHVLVPAWKRMLSGSLFIFSGIIVAASILAARSRVVRCISYARGPSGSGVPPSIHVQTASQLENFGNSYVLKDCWLSPSNENQLMLEIKGHGKWVLDVRGAKIADKLAPEDKALARSMMLKKWKAMDGSARSVL